MGKVAISRLTGTMRSISNFAHLDIVNKKVSDIRGRISNQYIQIELLINAYLVNYFAIKNKHNDFLVKFLCDDYCSVGLKINVLEKVLSQEKVYKEFYNDLRRLNSIRNIAVHSPPQSIVGPLVFHSKKMKSENLEDLEKEFVKLHNKIFSSLLQEIDKIIKENH